MISFIKTSFYILLEILGIGLFVLLGYFEITGLVGFLISMVGLAMIVYSTYNLFEKNMVFRFIILSIAELVSLTSTGYIEKDEKLNPKY